MITYFYFGVIDMNDLTKCTIKLSASIFLAGALFVLGARMITVFDVVILVIMSTLIGWYLACYLRETYGDYTSECILQLAAFASGLGLCMFADRWLYATFYPGSNLPVVVGITIGVAAFFVGRKMITGWQQWK